MIAWIQKVRWGSPWRPISALAQSNDAQSLHTASQMMYCILSSSGFPDTNLDTDFECMQQIPKCKNVESHPIAGKARINLTFRRLKPEWAGKSPCCRCNQQAVLKASLPSSATSQQRYYFACDNTKGPGCGFFSWAQIAV